MLFRRQVLKNCCFYACGLSDKLLLLSVGIGKQVTSPPVGKLFLRPSCDKIFTSKCITKFMLFLDSGSAVVINELTPISV